MSKYLFVVPTLSNGGAERVVSILASELSKTDEVFILKFFDTKNDYDISSAVDDSPLFKNEDEFKQANYWKRIKLVKKRISEIKPDFIIPFLSQMALYAQIACIGTPYKIFQSIRIDPAQMPPSKARRMIRDRMIYSSKCTFVQNQAQKDYFKKKAHDKIHILFNPISNNMFETKRLPQSKEYVICTLGRLENQKNHELLINAFIKAFQEDKEVVLKIYGEGSLKNTLQEMVEKKGFNDRITLEGRISDVAEVYSKAQMFVLSSDFEGMPNSLIEAMSIGLPCISTDCPTGPSDLIVNYENGILVPIKNIEEMSKAMRLIKNDEELSLKLGNNAKNTIIEKCRVDKIVEQLKTISEKTKGSGA